MWRLARPEGISEESNTKQQQINSLQAPSLPPLLKHLILAAAPSQSQDDLRFTRPNSQKNLLPDHRDGVKDTEAKVGGGESEQFLPRLPAGRVWGFPWRQVSEWRATGPPTTIQQHLSNKPDLKHQQGCHFSWPDWDFLFSLQKH